MAERDPNPVDQAGPRKCGETLWPRAGLAVEEEGADADSWERLRSAAQVTTLKIPGPLRLTALAAVGGGQVRG